VKPGHVLALVLAALVLVAACAGCTGGGTGPVDTTAPENGYRTVVDGRGVAVQVPKNIERVVTVSSGLIESVLFVLDEEEKIVGLGSNCVPKIYNYTYPTVGGEAYEYRGGMNPVAYLDPRLRDLPLVKESSTGMNYETLAGLDPDVVILRVGASGFPSMEDEGVQKTIRTIESLGTPVVVLKGPPCFDEPDLSTISDEIRIIGAVFGKEKQAGELAEYLESQTRLVFERTKDIPDAERPTVLVFGASPTARKAGGAGNVRGTDTIESYFVEEIVHAKNAFRNTGSPMISAEQLLALDPDAVVLNTWNGYHPPEELYSAPYYQNVGELSAVKNRRVYALPWTPCYSNRLEYPTHVMVIAKAAYPERFADVDLGEWLLDFYKNVYDVDDETAKTLRTAQWMDWCVEGGT
jgi:iron complex transport system substrate-binding protein